jgi:hypothetical protein
MTTRDIGMLTLAAALAAAMFLPTPLLAGDPDCAAKPAVDLDLVALKSGGDKTRIATATKLVNQWSRTLPTIMVALTSFPPSTTSRPNVQQDYFLSIVDVLRSILTENTEAIRVFRSCRNDAMIKSLVSAARGEHPGIRVNATLILGNVIDNTTVCFVLHQLRDPSISVPGRANLLGITVAMASYAYKENAQAIEETLRSLAPTIESEKGDLAQTKNLIADLRARVSGSSNRDTRLPQELRKYCAAYDYDQALD